jgi:hypothetical protein
VSPFPQPYPEFVLFFYSAWFPSLPNAIGEHPPKNIRVSKGINLKERNIITFE